MIKSHNPNKKKIDWYNSYYKFTDCYIKHVNSESPFFFRKQIIPAYLSISDDFGQGYDAFTTGSGKQGVVNSNLPGPALYAYLLNNIFCKTHCKSMSCKKYSNYCK